LSRKPKWFLFSGEALELWLAKTAFGLYESGHLAKGRVRLRDEQCLDPAILGALRGRRILSPCGLYIMASGDKHVGKRDSVDITAILSIDEEHMTGMTLTFMGLTFAIALDPRASYKPWRTSFTYRPAFIQYRNAKRFHSMVLSWPDRAIDKQRAVLFTKS
jgi:hypothetical protein